MSYSALRQRATVQALPLVGLARRSPTTTNCCMKRSRVGRRPVDGVHLEVGAELAVGVGVGRRPTRRTPTPSRAFSSSSMPAFAHACLTMACTFWRTELIEVWNTQLAACLPSFARTPSAPRFQPAASSSALALSTLNSSLDVRAVVLRRVVQEVGRRHAGAAVDEVLDALAVDQQRQRLAHRRVAEDADGATSGWRARRRPRSHGSATLSWIDLDVAAGVGRRRGPCRRLPCA